MCLAVPLRIREIKNNSTAVCERDGVAREVDISLIRDPLPGDYVIVHAGFAIERVKEREALDSLEALNELKEALAGLDSSRGA